MFRTLTVVTIAYLLGLGVATAGELSIETFALPGHGTLAMAVPDAWQARLEQPPGELPPTLELTAKSGPAFEFLVTPLWSAAGKTPALDDAGLRGEVESMIKAAQPQAIERAIEIKSLKGDSGVGYYFSATDRLPKPGEYKYMTQGIIPVGDLAVTFTILTNDGAETTVSAALLLLQDLSQKK